MMLYKFPVTSPSGIQYQFDIEENQYFVDGYNYEIKKQYKGFLGITRWKTLKSGFLEIKDHDFVSVAKNQIRLYEKQVEKARIKKEMIVNQIEKFEQWDGEVEIEDEKEDISDK